MSRSLTYIFPASNITDVCNLQNDIAGKFILNGNLANSTGSAIPFIDRGYSRSVNITSSDDLSVNSFFIEGYQNGVFIRETILAGPTAGQIVSSVQCYDTITAITTDQVTASTNVRIGSGYFGFMKLIGLNIERDVINYSLSTAKLTAVTIPTTLYQVFTDITNNGHTFLDIAANDFNLTQIDDGTNTRYVLPVANATLCKSWLLKINGTTPTAANSIQLNFIQT
jgi:hypothetical protein